jgi:hypothetical protein
MSDTGAANFTGQLTLGSTITNGSSTYTLPSSSGTLALTSAIPTNPVGGTGTQNYITKWNNAGGTTIGNSVIYDNGSSVLIGTTDDGGKLVSYSTSGGTQIKAAGVAPAITFSNTVLSPTVGAVVGAATSTNQFMTGTSAGDMIIACYFTGSIVFGTGSTTIERARFSSGGNLLLGIGTDAGYKLDVNGTGRFSGGVISESVAYTGIVSAYGSSYAQFSHTSRNAAGTYSFLSVNDGTTVVNASTGKTIDFRINNSNVLSIASTGAATFSGDLSIIKSSAYATITTDATTGVNFIFKQGGVVKHEIYTNTTQFAIYNTTTSAVALGIANATGAATFSSSVTAQGYFALTTTSDAYAIQGTLSWNSVRGTVISGKTASVFDFAVYGAAAQALITNPTGTSVISFPSGNVGIGTSSPNTTLDVNGTINVRTNGYEFGRIKTNNISANQGGLTFQFNQSGTFVDGIILSAGGTFQMLGNSTTFSIGSIAGVQRIQYGTGGYTTEFAFLQPNDGYTAIGAGAFNTRSDYRLKEDLKEFSGLSLVTNMKVYDFKWKEKDERNYGFMAHELQEVVPYVVTGTKDGMFEDEPQMQGLDYSKLVPVLVKAIQEQQAQIEELKLKIK